METINLLLTIEELKAGGFINANVDDEYIVPAIEEAQDVFLREILGDSLLDRLTSAEPEGAYAELVEKYVKYFLRYKAAGLLTMNVNFKIRNAGVVQQYGNEFNTTGLDDTKFIQAYYSQKADFYANRMTRFVELNRKSFPEYRWCCQQVTQPDTVHPVSTIYLG